MASLAAQEAGRVTPKAVEAGTTSQTSLLEDNSSCSHQGGGEDAPMSLGGEMSPLEICEKMAAPLATQEVGRMTPKVADAGLTQMRSC